MASAISMVADGTYRLNVGGANVDPDGGLALQFTVAGTNSLVLKANVAPPGAAQDLQGIEYTSDDGETIAADTAITASGIVYVTPAHAALDLYADLNWTSGSVLARAYPGTVDRFVVALPGSKFSSDAA